MAIHQSPSVCYSRQYESEGVQGCLASGTPGDQIERTGGTFDDEPLAVGDMVTVRFRFGAVRRRLPRPPGRSSSTPRRRGP